MALRKTPLVPGNIYHVFNRSIARQPIFLNNRQYRRMEDCIQYYLYSKPNLRFSHYDRLPTEKKNDFIAQLSIKSKRQVEIFAYCIMPNHFHFLLKELEPSGTIEFMRNIQNSYAKYFNLRYDRSGGLFQEMFKAVYIETDEQFIHVMRYIHLNPYTSYIVKSLAELEVYPWSSLPSYLTNRKSFIQTDFVKNFFKSTDDLKTFIYDQADYQRELDVIKHLTFEN